MYAAQAVRDRSSLMSDAPKRRKIPPLDAGRDFKHFEKIAAERDRRMPRWRRIFDLMMPNRQAFETAKQAGQDPTTIVDSYPQYAINRGVGKVKTALFYGKWFDLESGDEIPEDQEDEVNDALEHYRDLAFKTLDHTEFDADLSAMLTDVFVADGGMLLERGPSKDIPVVVRTSPLSEIYPIVGNGGEFIGNMRKYECVAADLESEFGGDGRKLDIPQSVRDKAATDPAFKVCLLEVSKLAPNVGQRCTVYLWDSKHPILDHVGHDPAEPSRWIIAGWTKIAGETYHRGPADRALETCEYYNFVRENKAKAAEKRLDPPLAIDVDSNINGSNLGLTPRAIVEYSSRTLDGRPPFQAFPIDAAAVQYANDEIDSLKSDIDTYLFSRATLPSVQESHQMTAQEVRTRAQQTLREEGANYSHLDHLGRLIAGRLFWILGTWGIVPPYLKIDGKLFAFRPAGPLASAQAADEATNDFAWMNMVAAASAGDPAAFHLNVRTENIGSVTGDKMNVSRGLIRSEEEKKQLMQAAAQAMQAQAEAQQQAAAPAAA